MPLRLNCIFCLTCIGLAGYSWGSASDMEGPNALYRIVVDQQREYKADAPVMKSAPVELYPVCYALHNKGLDAQVILPTFEATLHGRVTWQRVTDAASFSAAGTLYPPYDGAFLITVHEQSAVISIQDETNGWSRIDQTAEGYVLHKMNPDAVPECGSDHIPQLFKESPSVKEVPKSAAHKEEDVHISVMVVYTPASLSRAGSASAMESLILNAADMANFAYANSGIALSLDIVHMAEISYVEDYELALALAKLTFNNDGVMDEVHEWRDAYDADMVSLVASGGDVAGIGWILDSIDASMAQRAFSITTYYALGSHTFAHELGHNMGCDHDQQNITADGYRLFPYSRGWRFNAAENGVLYRTVMSYAPGTRIAHFSNPDILYRGTPTGVPVGQPDEAHCAMTINYSAPYLAQNRPSVVEGEQEGEDIAYQGYYCEKLGALYTNELLRDLLPPFALALFDLLNPESADLNGGADPETLTFAGNGMLDCGYELGVLNRILETSTLDLSATGGATHTAVLQAYNNNRIQIVADIGGSNAAIVNGIAPGLLELAAAYITLGDAGSIDFISGLLDVINDAYFVGALNLSAYALLPEYLSATGDADGDGASNYEEYQSYANYGPDAYVTFALNPSVYPNNTGNGQVAIVGRPVAVEGKSVTLKASLAYLVGEITLSWYKNNEAVPGAIGEELSFPSIALEDAGVYKLVATDESKALYESAPFYLQVIPESSLPIDNIIGMIVLASVILLLFHQNTSTVRAIRRHVV